MFWEQILASLCVPRGNWKLRPECDLTGRKSMNKDEGLWWLRDVGCVYHRLADDLGAVAG